MNGPHSDPTPVPDVAVVCVGQVMVDVLARLAGPGVAHGTDTPACTAIELGGAAANVARWLAALGTRTRLVAAVGDDLFGRFAADGLARTGLELALSLIPNESTGCCIVLVDEHGERSMAPSVGANTALDPVRSFGTAHWLYVSGYALLEPGSRAATLTTLRAARAAGLQIAVDGASAGPLRAAGPAAVGAWLDEGGQDLIVFANLDEAAVLAGRSAAPAELAAVLADRHGTAVIKGGTDGAWLAGRGTESRHVPAVRADPVDSTGAGDAFAAGVLHARAAGADWAVALELGTKTAATVVGRVGAGPA